MNSRTRRCVFFFAAIMLLIASDGLAGDTRTAKYGGEFLSLGVGGRALGMGSAFAALATDVTAGYWNPAGLSGTYAPEVMLMHTQQFGGVVKYDYGSFALPVGTNRTLGISLIRVGVDDIFVTALSNPNLKLGDEYEDEDGITRANRPYVDRTISDAEYALFFSYGFERSRTLSLGANAKIIRKGIGDFSAWGLGFDLGALYRPTGNLRLGVNLQDITTTVISWENGTREIIIPTVKAGVAYPFEVKALNGTVSPAFDFDVRFEGRKEAAQLSAGAASLDTHAGIEYQFRDRFALRAGSDVGRFTAGAGIYMPKFQFDYAFVGHEELGNTHRISAKLSISGSN